MAGVSSEGSTGKDSLLSSHGYWQNLVLWSLDWEVPSWQSDRGHPQFLTMWAFPAWQLFSLDMQAQKALKSLLARWKPQFYVTKSWKWQLKTFAVFCWLEASDRPHPHSRGEDYTKVWLPEGRLRLLPHWVTVRTANLWNQMRCKRFWC